MASARLRGHPVVLTDGNLALRPLTEDDWKLVLHLNDDEEIGWFVEGDRWEPPDLATLQSIYRRTSQTAYCFVAELAGRPIGECWLQLMNLPRLIGRWPDLDLRRIDLLIRDKTVWGQGVGSRMISLLTTFGFEVEEADAIFGCDIWEYNRRSLGAFRRSGYDEELRVAAPAGARGVAQIDMVRWRQPHPGAGATVSDPPLAEAEIGELLDRLSNALSMPAWITGGVGIDLLLGRLTRAHDDIDLLIDRRRRHEAFTDLDRAGFRVTKDLGWYSRWTTGKRVIGELDVSFVDFEADRSATLIVCPEEAIGIPGRYSGVPGELDDQRIGRLGRAQFRVVSAESQWALRRAYAALFPEAPAKPKIDHDVRLLEEMLAVDVRDRPDNAPLERRALQVEDCDRSWTHALTAGRGGLENGFGRAQIQLSLIEDATRQLAADGIPCWLSGGWAVDFHLGEITREHDDIDLLVFASNADRAVGGLVAVGYELLSVGRPEEHRHLRRHGERVSLTLIEYDQRGHLITPGRWSDWPYAPGVLDAGPRAMSDVICEVMSVPALIAEKKGFSNHPCGGPPRPRDRADLMRLHLLLQDPSHA